MRKTIYILFAILGMSLFAGCDDDKKDNNTPLAKQLVGEWRLTSWTGQAPQVFDAYIAFDGGSFTIYQKIESVKYQKHGQLLAQRRCTFGKLQRQHSLGKLVHGHGRRIVQHHHADQHGRHRRRVRIHSCDDSGVGKERRGEHAGRTLGFLPVALSPGL